MDTLKQICIEKPHLGIVELGKTPTEVDYNRTEKDRVIPSNSSKHVSDQSNVPEDDLLASLSSKSVFGKSMSYWVLLTCSGLAVILGSASGALLGRLYFVHGGSHRWIYTWIQTAGFPVILVPLILLYYRNSIRPTRLSLKVIAFYTGISFLFVVDNLLYSWGLSYLPVSTSSLLCSTQLAFTALFSYFLLKRKFTPFMLNSVVVITMGAVLLGLHSDSDRPAGTTQNQYIAGYVLTTAAALFLAVIVTVLEVFYKRVAARNACILMLESQVYINVLATIFTMMGMWINNDFKALREEARIFDKGSSSYTVVLISGAVSWQFCFLGTVGLISLASSLIYAVLMTASLPVVPILAVFFFHDSFSALKAMSMLLSIWGFASYSYGAYLDSKVAPPQ